MEIMGQFSDYHGAADYASLVLEAAGLWWVSDDILSHGGSSIVGPLGTFLAELGWDKEDIVYVTLNRSDMIEAKAKSSHAVLVLNCVLIIWFDLKMDFNPVGS